MTESATQLLVWGIVVHLVADWLLQNNWMAAHKHRLIYPAAYVHAGIHGLGLALVFSWPVALALAISHLLIDTRVPLTWWSGWVRSTEDASINTHVQIWRDQVLHIALIAGAALLVSA